MLARTPKTSETDFASILKIPAKPAAISEADAAWQHAVSQREAGQARHIEATRQLYAQVPGQPPVITLREVEEIGLTREPLFKAEKDAAEKRSSLRERYDQDTHAFLASALDRFSDAVSDKLGELETLLGLGSALHAASVAAGVKLPRRLPSVCGNIINSSIYTARNLVRHAALAPAPVWTRQEASK
ncbi:hypothetical protein [Mesorhizobium sp. LNJC405B00]|uniref:hypothetical protein n=1 Tax=unclassified Mesorhizobium TaxID=325217 RepID=UPI0003CE1A1B|nr:hypothetical protein [Mesorhizobium sp. LNJC405B00]ESX98734.1 hypothetical protein X755_15595 [Mesorhizobium sp. LNJC405B00]